MNQHFTEQAVVFTSISKWIFLSAIVGAICGALIVQFLNLLHWAETSRYDLSFPFYFLLPFALVFTVWLVRKVAPNAEGHGTEKVIESIHKDKGDIDVKVIPVKVMATVMTIFAGGSVGKEGPGAQIGAATASLFSKLFHFSPNDRKKLVICGISAGFATVFGTPMAGAIFGVEILVVGAIMYDVLLPSIVAGLSAYAVAQFLGLEYTLIKASYFDLPGFDITIAFWVVLAGIFFGLVSDLMINMIQKIHQWIRAIKWHYLLTPFVGGIVIAVLAYFTSTRYLGLGMETIWLSLSNEAILHQNIQWYDAPLKALFTALSLGVGGSGGIITPLFFVGATSGNVFGHLVEGYIPFFAALGLVSVLAGATNAPIAAIIMAGELFGMEIIHYAALSCIIAFLMTGHRSVFPSQILAMTKGEHLDVEMGKEIKRAQAKYTGGLEPDSVRDMRRRIAFRRALRQKRRPKK
jgi:H+/Cl- antiporter ClcA